MQKSTVETIVSIGERISLRVLQRLVQDSSDTIGAGLTA